MGLFRWPAAGACRVVAAIEVPPVGPAAAAAKLVLATRLDCASTQIGRTQFLNAILMRLTSLVVLAMAVPCDAKAGGEVFGDARLWSVHLRVSREGWNFMHPTLAGRGGGLEGFIQALRRGSASQPASGADGKRLPPNVYGYDFAYVRATARMDGVTYHDVGLRFSGNASYRSASDIPKRSFKIDFDRFVAGQTFQKVKTLNLHNNSYDPECLREWLAYWTFRQLGVPAPRTAFAVVYLTVDGLYDELYLGLYNLVEQVERKAFSQAPFCIRGWDVAQAGASAGFAVPGIPWRAVVGLRAAVQSQNRRDAGTTTAVYRLHAAAERRRRRDIRLGHRLLRRSRRVHAIPGCQRHALQPGQLPARAPQLLHLPRPGRRADVLDSVGCASLDAFRRGTTARCFPSNAHGRATTASASAS